MFSFNPLLKSNAKSIKTAFRTISNKISRKSFASMAKFNYQDALNLESLLTEEEKMVNLRKIF